MIAAHIATAAVVDITGTLAVVTAAVGILGNHGQSAARSSIPTANRWTAKHAELTRAIGDLIRQAIDVFYQKLSQVYKPLEVFLQRPGRTLQARARTG